MKKIRSKLVYVLLFTMLFANISPFMKVVVNASTNRVEVSSHAELVAAVNSAIPGITRTIVLTQNISGATTVLIDANRRIIIKGIRPGIIYSVTASVNNFTLVNGGNLIFPADNYIILEGRYPTTGTGGGVGVNSPLFPANPSLVSVFIMNGGIIRRSSGASGSRGIVDVFPYARFVMNGGVLEDNHHTGVNIHQNSEFIMNDGVIRNNMATAGNQGGAGVHVFHEGRFELNDGIIEENIHVNIGGGVFLADRSEMIMNGGVIRANETNNTHQTHRGRGGGIFVGGWGVELTINNGLIYGNQASREGGGIYLDSHRINNAGTTPSVTAIYGGIIKNNIAMMNGGGIFVSGETGTAPGFQRPILNIENVTIEGNLAALRGGGIFHEGLGTTTIRNGIIRNNSAGGGGGLSGTSRVTIQPGVRFYGNDAFQGLRINDQMFLDNPNIRPSQWTIHQRPSGLRGNHAFNNLDIEATTQQLLAQFEIECPEERNITVNAPGNASVEVQRPGHPPLIVPPGGSVNISVPDGDTVTIITRPDTGWQVHPDYYPEFSFVVDSDRTVSPSLIAPPPPNRDITVIAPSNGTVAVYVRGSRAANLPAGGTITLSIPEGDNVRVITNPNIGWQVHPNYYPNYSFVVAASRTVAPQVTEIPQASFSFSAYDGSTRVHHDLLREGDTLPSVALPDRPGQTSLGWFIRYPANSTLAEYFDGATNPAYTAITMPGHNLIIEARFSNRHLVHLYAYQGATRTTQGSEGYSVGAEVIVPALEEFHPQRTGFYHIGWETIPTNLEITWREDIEKYSFIMPDQVVILTGLWGENYFGVALQNYPYNIQPANQQIVGGGSQRYGDTVVARQGRTSGWTFMDWEYDVTATINPDNLTFLMPAEDVELVALWGDGDVVGLSNAYNVSFVHYPFLCVDTYLIGAISPSGYLRRYYDDLFSVRYGHTMTAATIQRRGFHFEHWYIEDIGEISGNLSFIMPPHDIIVMVNWGDGNGNVGYYRLYPVTIRNIRGNEYYYEEFEDIFTFRDQLGIDSQFFHGYAYTSVDSRVNARPMELKLAEDIIDSGWNINNVTVIERDNLPGLPIRRASANLTQASRFFKLLGYTEVDILWVERYRFEIQNQPVGNVNNQTRAGWRSVGDNVIIDAGTRQGHRFAGWTSDDVILRSPSQTNTSFTMPNGHALITAQWNPFVRVSILNAGEGYAIQAQFNDGIAVGDIVRIFAGEMEGYEIYEWRVTGDYDLTEISEDLATKEFVVQGDIDLELVWENDDNGNLPTRRIIRRPTRPAPLPVFSAYDGQDLGPPAPWILPPGTDHGQAPNTFVHRRYIAGFPDGTFRPNASLTRAEMTAIFFNLSNDPTKYNAVMQGSGFRDISSNQWFYRQIAYFTNLGVLSGFPDGTFRPNQVITNAEFAAFAVQAFNLDRLGIENVVPGMAGHWAETFVRIGFDTGWFAYFGEGYVFNPDAAITRAQAVTLLNHYTGRVPSIPCIDAYLGARRIFFDLDRNHWAFYEVMEAAITHTFIREGSGKRWIR